MMPLSDKILTLKKLIDEEKDPHKIVSLLENLKKLISGLPAKNLKQREQKASEYLSLGNLVLGLVTANVINISYVFIAELYNQGLNLIPVVHSSLSAELINGIATAKFLNGETTLAIQFFQDAIRIYKELPLSDDRYGMIHANLANCYLNVKDYSKALENYELAERLCQESENKILNIFNQVVTCCESKNFDAVIVNFDRALKELKTLYPDSKELPLVVYLKTQAVHAGRLRKAIFAYFTALLQANQYQRILEFSANLLNDSSLCTYDDKLSLECVADAHVALEQFSAAIECYNRVLHDLQLHTEFYTRCSEKRIQCILAYGQHLYEQNDLPNALLQFQKVTSEVFFGEKNLEYKFLAYKMSVDILMQQNERDAALTDYLSASKIGTRLVDNPAYRQDTALLHYKMVESLKDEEKLEKYWLIYNLLQQVPLDGNTFPIYVDVTGKIGQIYLRKRDYKAAALKLEEALKKASLGNKERDIANYKGLIYVFMCMQRFTEAAAEIDELATIPLLDDSHQELKICLSVYKVYCHLQMKQSTAIEFTSEAIEQLFVIDPLVIEAKILGYKILADNYNYQGKYEAAVKCYQMVQSLLDSHKPDINLFDPEEIAVNLNNALRETDIFAALENLLAEKFSDKKEEILKVGLKILENNIQHSQIESFKSVIDCIDTALREDRPSIAYDFFETVWERLQKALIIGVKLTPEEYRKLTPEECKQVKNVQRILIDKQSEYRGEYRDEHKQRGEPLITVPHALLNMTIKYIASHEQAVITKGVPNLGGEKIVGYIKKIVVETKSDGTNAAIVLKEPIKKRFTPESASVTATISDVADTLLEVGFFSSKFTDPELENLDACQTIRLFDALAAEHARFENEQKSMDIDNKIENINNTQRSMEDTQQKMKENLLKLEELIGKAKNKLSRKRKIEKLNEEDSKDDYNKFAKR